jgi:hypothetical protein
MIRILDLNYRFNNDSRQWFDLNNQSYEFVRPNFWNPPHDPGIMLGNPGAYSFFDVYRDQEWDIVIESLDPNWGETFTKINEVFNPKIRLQLNIWHIWENMHEFYNSHPENGLIISPTKSANTDTAWLWSDWCLNLEKSYYHGYPYSPGVQLQYYPSTWDSCGSHYIQGSYVQPSIESLDKKTKIFINPGRTYNLPGQRVRKYREKIFLDLFKNFSNVGHFGNTHYDPTLWMHAQHVFPDQTNINKLMRHKPVQDVHGGKDGPIHNAYYRDTYISVFAETIEFGNSYGVTEKTLEPLIHGHFILPFSNAHFLPHVLDMGFQLPDFIDYSYDLIEDDERRWQAHCEESHRLLSQSQSWWQQQWETNVGLLQHNQRVLHHAPYHHIDLESLLTLPKG